MALVGVDSGSLQDSQPK